MLTLDQHKNRFDLALQNRAEAASLGVSALEEQIERTSEDLSAKCQERDEYYTKFTGLQVCLSILFNDNYVLLLINGDLIMQEILQNHQSEPSNIIIDQSSHFDYIQELVDRCRTLPTNLASTVIGLSGILSSSNDYFEEEESSVEMSIDAHIGEQVPEGNDIATAPSDYRILLSYLDSMPV